MIKILKERAGLNEKTGINEKTFRQTKIVAESVETLFLNIEKYVNEIPERERYNLHYTLCNCDINSDKQREFLSQNIIPFDIDNINVSEIDSYVSAFFSVVKNVNASDCALVSSGRGLHILIGTTNTITTKQYFVDSRADYKYLCDKIEKKLRALNLPGNLDPAIWTHSHTLRLPMTKNIKTPETGYHGKNFTGECVLISRVINKSDVTVKSLADLDIKEGSEDFVNSESIYTGGKYHVDDEGVLGGCDFIKWCKENPNSVREPQWLALASVLVRLKNGKELFHEYSKGHEKYSFEETEAYAHKARHAFKPRTCKNIETLWDGCQACPNYNKCVSPYSIKSDNYIKTSESGFRNFVYNKDWVVIKKDINYQDLIKQYGKEFTYLNTPQRSHYVFNGKYWEEKDLVFIRVFCKEKVDPAPTDSERETFVKLLLDEKIWQEEWFAESVKNKMNLKNGVLDLTKRPLSLQKHSPEFGFKNCLEYEYDPLSTSPLFDIFLKDITCDRKELEDVLLEYLGYSLSGMPCDFAKCLFLLGEGSNGKSTLLDVLKELVGEKSFTSFMLNELNDKHNLIHLNNVLFNIGEETPRKSLQEGSMFKNLVTGGSVQARRLYKDSLSFTNRCKLIFSCNDLPYLNDLTHGLFRRLLIVPFDATFDENASTTDKQIKYKMFKEMSGILNRVIEAYDRLINQKGFTESRIVRRAVDNYRQENDIYAQFVEDTLSIDENTGEEGVTVSQLYACFKKYCENSGEKFIPTKIMMSKALRKTVPSYDQRRSNKRRGGTSEAFLKGVTINQTNSAF